MTTIDAKLRKALAGISGILVTPFDAADRLAPARLKPIVDRAVAAGVHALVANGNTGEFYGLTTKEAETTVHAVADRAAMRVDRRRRSKRQRRLRVGQGLARRWSGRAHGASTARSVRIPRGVVSYIQRIADAAEGLPIMLYLRNDGIGLDAIVQLCNVPGVAGVKWACPTPLRLAEAIRRCSPRSSG